MRLHFLLLASLLVTAPAAAQTFPSPKYGTVTTTVGVTLPDGSTIKCVGPGTGCAASGPGLSSETTRALAAEAVNAAAITTETSRAQSAEGTNASAISTETSRAQSAEGANATAITAGVAAAKNASNLTTGTVPIGQLPVGTASGTVAAGNKACDITGATDCSGAMTTATGATTPRTSGTRAGERKSTEDFRTVGGTTQTDDATLQAAINAGGDVYVPAGTYNLCLTAQTLTGNLRIHGAGKDISILQACPSSATKNQLINSVAGGSNVTIEDVTLQGNWGAPDPTNPGSYLYSQTSDGALALVKNANNVTIRRVAVRGSRAFGFQLRFATNVDIDDFTCEYSNRDCIAIWDASQVRINNGYIHGTEDSAISLHVDSDAVAPTRSMVSVNNVDLVDAHGVDIEGFKQATITNIRSFRSHGTVFTFSPPVANSQGDTNRWGLFMSNISIYDQMSRQWFIDGGGTDGTLAAILIDGIPMAAGGLGAVPTYNNPATGTIISPLGQYFTNDVVQNGLPVMPTKGVRISGLTIGRTLAPVANYSSWGYGKAFAGTQGWSDAAVTATNLLGKGPECRGPMQDVSLSDFDIEPGSYCLRFTATTGQAWVASLFRNVIIRNGTLSHCSSDVVQFYGQPNTALSQDIKFDGVTFDGDPEFIAGNRTVNGVTGKFDGTWAANSIPFGIDASYIYGLQATNSTFKNVSSPVNENGLVLPQTNYYFGNNIKGKPLANGFSTSNGGVGRVYPPGADWWYQPEETDPTSANFGQTLNLIPRSAAAMPTSGYHVAGEIVASQSFSTGLSGTPNGWARLTTGPNNDAVTGLTVTVAGTGGTSGTYPLIITGAGGFGSGAAGTCTTAGSGISSVTLSLPGFGYVAAPTVTCPGAGVAGATLTATVSMDWAALYSPWAPGAPFLGVAELKATNGSQVGVTGAGTASNYDVALLPTGTGRSVLTGSAVLEQGAVHDSTVAFILSASVTAGATQTAAANTDGMLLGNTAAVSTQTVKLPPITGVLGQVFTLSSDGGITTLTLQTSGGGAITNSPTALSAGVGRTMISDGTVWHIRQ